MQKESDNAPKTWWLRRAGKSVADSCRTSHVKAWHDLKIRWARGLLLAFYLCIALAAVYFLSLLIRVSVTASYFGFVVQSTACLPDGRFSLHPFSFQFWTEPEVFEITVGFGDLSFTRAKVIDIIWDVVVGRGGQALLALISGKAFATYITTTMQIAPVTFDTFRTFFIHRDTSTITGISRMARGAMRKCSVPSRAAALSMIITMLFVLAFPTAAGAMTGYSANVQAFVQDESGRFVPFSSFSYLFYTIHDGERISRTKEVQVKSLDKDGEPVLETDTGCGGYQNKGHEQCQLLVDVTTYVLKYGIQGATNSTTFFGKDQVEVKPPSLNITAYYVPFSHLYGGYYNFTDPSEIEKVLTPTGRDFNLTDTSRLTWFDGKSSTFLQRYIEKNGRCQPTKTYKWGFSFVQLLIMTCLLDIWALGIYIIHIRSHIAALENGQSNRVAGEYLAILQFSDAIHAQVKQNCDEIRESDLSSLNEKELRRCIHEDLEGGSISYENSFLDRDQSSGTHAWVFRDWLKKERRWLIWFATTVGGCFVIAWMCSTIILGFLLPLQVLFTMYVGRSTGSRVVLFSWQLILLSATAQLMMILIPWTLRVPQ